MNIKTNLSIIVAMDENNLIGRDNSLPWHLPADLKYFKQQTLNKTILMGRKTCESLPYVLPQRRNVVLTRNVEFTREGFEIIHKLDGINDYEDEAMIIGGAMIYKLLMPYVKKLLITKIHHQFDGDTNFSWNPADWKIASQLDCQTDEKNLYNYSFMEYHRK